jgi:alkylation response protein AidB-like acyl-CoA dehydrogenase
MAIALSDAHRELEEVARSFLLSEEARSCARALLDAPEEARPPFWERLAGLGWLGLHIGEEYGGSGYGLPELVVVLEELGRVLAPGPFVPTVIASAVVADLAGEDLRSRLLPGLVDGTASAAVGFGGSLAIDNGSVSGDAGVVLGLASADLLLLAAGDDMVLLPARSPGIEVSPASSLDLTRRCLHVRLAAAGIEDGQRLVGARTRALDLARVIAAAEAAGGARACMEMASEYAKVREQFGRVIGTFGPVKHHCANMLVAAELSTASVWDAARAASSGDPQQFSLAAASAVTEAMPAFLVNSQLNIQVHGGIGFTWEHDAHVYLRRASTLSALFEPQRAAADVARLAAAGVESSDTFQLPPEAESIRAEVAPLIDAVAVLPVDQRRARLVASGLAQPHWPRPWGRAASALEQIVIDEEMTRAGVDRLDYGITGWVILTLIQKAAPDQIERWVKPTLLGELMWCQLFSEPNAGSDAAGIRTRGTRVEGGWLVNGQKVWTSGAQHCQRGLATVRTDPEAPKHAGVTTMVIDMQAEGVEVRPLREASGGALFNEVFFEEVFVPDDDVVGPVNGGWTVARSTLGNERVSIGRGGIGSGIDLGALAAVAAERGSGAEAGVGRLLAEASAMRALNLRRAERAVAGGEPGPEGNVTKLLSAEHAQRTADTALALLGPDVALSGGLAGAVGSALVFTRCLSIAGGTSEITRNQIAERILGLPRDPLIK